MRHWSDLAQVLSPNINNSFFTYFISKLSLIPFGMIEDGTVSYPDLLCLYSIRVSNYYTVSINLDN